MVPVNQFAFADFEADVAGHRNDCTGDDLDQLDQPAFHYGGPTKLAQKPNIRHRYLKQVERGIGKDNGENARNEQNKKRRIFL